MQEFRCSWVDLKKNDHRNPKRIVTIEEKKKKTIKDFFFDDYV